MSVLNFADLGVLAIALVVFIAAGFPLLGFGVCAGAWLISRGLELAATRKVATSIVAGRRNTAMGTMAAATLGRVWIVALAILLVGLSDRDAGLAAAILAFVLVTVHMAARGFAHLISSDDAALAARGESK